MNLIDILSSSVILLVGIYFFILGLTALFTPKLTERFLLGFADSRIVHYVELALRLAVGGAFIQYAPHMLFSDIYTVFAWIIIGTTACVLLLPWRWHRSFAQKVVPRANRHLKVIGNTSLVIGVAIFVSF